ncbi:MAG: DNA-directed RNA polymerase subunit beta [Patescibacteria group bacterium]
MSKTSAPKTTKSTNTRQSFKPSTDIALDDLVQHQNQSFQWFVQEGLGELLAEVSPIDDYTGEKLSLRFKDYRFEDPKITEQEARRNNASYEVTLKGKVELTNKVTGEVKEQEIYMGDYPWMTSRGTFIVNGSERVVVSQLARSAGVFFTANREGAKNYYGAKVVPGRGAWLEIETSKKGAIFVKIDRRRKVAITTFLRALGMSDADMKEAFKHVDQGQENYIDMTLEKDTARGANESLIEVYRRLRPGDLATLENARTLLEDMFFSTKRFDFSRVGRYKVNNRLDLDVPNTAENRVLRLDDIKAIVAEVIRLNNTQEAADDIDSLSNRRVKLVGELVQRQFRIGLLRMERNTKDRMSMSEIETVTPGQLVNARPVVAAVREFFASSQLSQFMDQVNPLSELAHKRRLSSMGPGGLSRERAGFEVRDAHQTHYGRICPVETPEGPNIGLVLNMAMHARINDYGFIETPYYRVKSNVTAKDAVGEVALVDLEDAAGKVIVKAGKKITAAESKKLATVKEQITWPIKARVTDEVVYLDADGELSACIAGSDTQYDKDGFITDERIRGRKATVAGEYDREDTTHLDASRKQIIGSSAGLIPFIEKDYVLRSLVGSNQARQAVPLINPESPVVGTGLEEVVAKNSGQVIYAEGSGTVTKATAEEVVVSYAKTKSTYKPEHFIRSNDSTAINQRVVVSTGQKVKAGDILIEGTSMQGGELALGRDALVALMPWSGYNFEDAIIISDRLVKEDQFTSVTITDYMVEVRETKLGPEVITRDIPNVSEEALRHLDEEGIVRIGAEVEPGDILVGKIVPKGEQELSSEERLLRAIFGEKAKDVRDGSRRMPTGKSGKVIEIRTFSKEQGHELKAGVLRQVQVFVAQTRKIQIGDKLAGRHGNKGVIARVLPEADMPFTENGTPVDILLNPLGVPSRMNIGQLFEAHLGMAAKELGIKVSSPAFDGVANNKVSELLAEAGLPEDGKQQLFDGRTGEPLKERTTVGLMYIYKLNHMINDKIHARSTGPYTMVTQQPLGGKAQNGGQRFGEMEVWALEAYGAASSLQEMLTLKSDDVFGRAKAYESIIKQTDIVGPKVPESFNVLVKELQGLSLKVDLINTETNTEVDAEELLEQQIKDESSDAPTVDVPADDNAGDTSALEDAVADEFSDEDQADVEADNAEDADDQVEKASTESEEA